MNTEDRIRKVLATLLQVAPEEIHADFGPTDAPRWDSLNALRIVTALEAEFGIRLTMAEITSMNSFSRIAQVIGSKA